MREIDQNIKNQFGKQGNEKSFRVPENYFDSFSERLSEKILEEKQKTIAKEEVNPTKTISLWEKVKPLATFAAIFIGFGLFTYIPFSIMKQNNQLKQLATVEQSQEEVIENYYFSDNYSLLFSDLHETESVEESISQEELEYYLVAEMNSYEIGSYNN